MTAQSFYEEKVRLLLEAITSSKRKLVLSALFRMVSFSVSVISGYLFFREHQGVLLLLSILFFLLFLMLVVFAVRLKERKALQEKFLFICNNELGVLRNEPNQMDDGREYSNTDSYSADLDIFGPRSLFHVLNRCTTSHGKTALANALEHPLQDAATIKKHQEAVQILATQPEERLQTIAQGLLYGEKEGNLHNLETWLQPATRLHKMKWLRFVLWMVPLYNISSFLYYLATDNILPFLAGFAVAWIITARYAKYIHQQHLHIGKKQGILHQYSGILKSFLNVGPGKSVLLEQLRQTALHAHVAIGRLAKLSSFFDQRLNLLVNLFLNSFLLYDLRCLLALEHWKEANRKSFPEWLSTVGNMECLQSLASFAWHHPHYCYPEIQEGEFAFISAEEMGHPLIAVDERIANSFEAGKHNRLLLITGSNMSGKTTFLRTLGVNLILAQNGAPVCAKSFSCIPMEILTAIRVNDSLQEHTSYFMAELKRLQHIIERLHRSRSALVLIDEILRGTNSEDKTYGSEQFILQLLRYNCITLFATHDLSLGKLETTHEGKISNYCFESSIADDKLFFDYKLRSGIATNKNASFLMKQMGILNPASQ
ncbi:MAG: hypothetical protein IT250_00345 [Chitinophagaceae bacterium]|nr:hypothetical protein [Chitinophagaceae bacterium]